MFHVKPFHLDAYPELRLTDRKDYLTFNFEAILPFAKSG